MGQLDGKVAIVTGLGRGIGQQVALRLAWDGAGVVVNDLDDEPVAETIRRIQAMGGKAVACNGDVRVGVQRARIAALNQIIPLGRGGTPEEGARAIYLFCSPDSDYVSGQTLVVTGGL